MERARSQRSERARRSPNAAHQRRIGAHQYQVSLQQFEALVVLPLQQLLQVLHS
jgi:hypothetical protein